MQPETAANSSTQKMTLRRLDTNEHIEVTYAVGECPFCVAGKLVYKWGAHRGVYFFDADPESTLVRRVTMNMVDQQAVAECSDIPRAEAEREARMAICLHGEAALTCNLTCACGHSCAAHNNPESGACAIVLHTAGTCACGGFLFPHNFAQVTLNGDGRVAFHLPAEHRVITRGEAAVLAAWLLAVAGTQDEISAAVLANIRRGRV